MNKKILLSALSLSSMLGLISLQAQAINLQQSFQLALEHDLTYASAKSILNQSIAKANLNWANFLPQIAIKYSGSHARNYDYPKRFGTQDNSQLSIVLSQNIFNFVDFLKLDIAKQQKIQAEVTYLSSRQDLISRVITGYIEILKANSNVKISLKQEQYLQDLVKNTNTRFKNGLVSEVNLEQVQAQLAGAKATYLGNLAKLNLAINNFRVIVGDNADLSSLDGIGNVIPVLPYTKTSNSQIIANNLTLKSLAMSKAIANTGIKASKAAILPNIALQASYSNNPKNNTLPFNSGWINAHKFNTFYLGVTITIPIFTGGQIYNGIKYAEALYQQANLGYQLAYQKTKAGLDSNSIAIQANQSIITSYKAGMKAAKLALASSLASFKHGLGTITEVFNASNQLYSTEQNLIDAKYNYIEAIIKQKYLLGTLSEQDIDLLNKGFTVKEKIDYQLN